MGPVTSKMTPEDDRHSSPPSGLDSRCTVVKIKGCGQGNGIPSSGSLDRERGEGDRGGEMEENVVREAVDGVEGLRDGRKGRGRDGVGERRGGVEEKKEGIEEEGGKGKEGESEDEEEKKWVKGERRCSVDCLMM
ncbi:MAG: hypothetical protein Q9192_006931 [Flavoplaca navasiana]